MLGVLAAHLGDDKPRSCLRGQRIDGPVGDGYEYRKRYITNVALQREAPCDAKDQGSVLEALSRYFTGT
jgi:hypothetical protein